MPTNKILDVNALYAIKDYIDNNAGKVDDVQINGSTIISNKVANIAVDGTYNSSSNKVATKSTVTNAINALDGTITGSAGSGKTLTAFGQTDGKVSATFGDISITSSQISDKTDTYSASGTAVVTGKAVAAALGTLDGTITGSAGASTTLSALSQTDGKVTATFTGIQIAESQVTNLTNDLAAKVPNTRKIAGIALSADISASSLVSALGLSSALTYIGVTTTTKPSAGNYVQTVIGGTTYYVSLTSSGTATQVNAQKGMVLSLGTTSKEYVCTTAGASGTNVFTELGDESSFALKSVSITGTGALGGGGTLAANRSITHNAGNAASKPTGFYKFSTDAYSHVGSVTAVAKADLTGLGVADNDTVVHLAGAETISGKKTFSNADGIAISNSGHTANISIIDYSGVGNLRIGGVYSISLPAQANTTFLYTSTIGASGSGNTLSLGSTEDGQLTLTNGTYSSSSLDANVIYKTNWYNGSTSAVSTYGVKFPDTHGYTANRTLATTADIPSVSSFVTGPSSATEGRIAVFDGTTGKKIKDGGTLLSTITGHVNNSEIHVTSANKTTWNGKIGALSWTSTGSGNDEHYLLKYGASSADTTVLEAMSYNDAMSILEGN